MTIVPETDRTPLESMASKSRYVTPKLGLTTALPKLMFIHSSLRSSILFRQSLPFLLRRKDSGSRMRSTSERYCVFFSASVIESNRTDQVDWAARCSFSLRRTNNAEKHALAVAVERLVEATSSSQWDNKWFDGAILNFLEGFVELTGSPANFFQDVGISGLCSRQSILQDTSNQ